MLPCDGCAYKASIPGNCHIRCKFDWLQMPDKIPTAEHGRQWFSFPFNYDPVWGPDECAARSEAVDAAKMAKESPLADIISLLS